MDDGAVNAILKNGKSLLPTGITAVEGDFGVGAAVRLMNCRQQPLGIGLVNYTALEIRTIMGLKTGQIKGKLGSKPYDEVIHRDNLVITER